MFYSELINKAIDISYSAHHGQTDKAGRPYFLHPATVASKMDTEAEICTAFLHDVVEDTAIPIEELRAVFPPEITDAVDVLTHREGMSWEDYIRTIKTNPIARKVKLSDLAHNMDITRLSGRPDLMEDYEQRRAKYEMAEKILNDA